MKLFLAALMLSFSMVGSLSAATITNTDDEILVVLVTEEGNKIQIAIAAGETVKFCSFGCFVMMPSGDRETLIGDEKVEIVNRSAVIK